MKKILFFILIVGLSSISAYDINFSKPFTTKVNPDTLSTQIYIENTNKDEKKIRNILDKFNTFFKEIKNIKVEKGRYSISPIYEYSKGKTRFTKYQGELTYTVKAENAKEINTFISKFLSFKKDFGSKNIVIRISNIQWEISETLYTKTREELRIQPIIWINNYVKELAKKLNNICKIKDIKIANTQEFHPYENRVQYATKSFDSLKDTAPIRSNKNITLTSNFTIECK